MIRQHLGYGRGQCPAHRAVSYKVPDFVAVVVITISMVKPLVYRKLWGGFVESQPEIA